MVLFSFLTAACDQSGNDRSQTDTEAVELGETTDNLQTEAPVAPQASTSRDIPGSDEASLVSKRTIIDNADLNDDLSTFTSLMRSANMVKNLSGTGPYTVLAPSNEAFDALPSGTLEDLRKTENQEKLQQILNNHIIAGKLTTEDLQDGAILKTAADQQLKVYKREGQTRVGGAMIEDSDAMSRNGVLHTINKVLVPIEEE